MGRRLNDIPFGEWVEYLFGHSVTKPAWYWSPDCDWWDAGPATAVRFVTRLFEGSRSLLHPYSDEQVNQGLWGLIDAGCFGIMQDIFCGDGVPLPERQKCIRSVLSLFQDCFAVRCSEHLSSLDQPGANAVNSVCYMWWDILPISGDPENPSQLAQDREFLAVMRDTLAIPSIACREKRTAWAWALATALPG